MINSIINAFLFGVGIPILMVVGWTAHELYERIMKKM